MNILTPSWYSFFTGLTIVLPILVSISAGFLIYIDKNLPIKYKRAPEINAQLDSYNKPTDSNALWKASEFFKTVPFDHLTDKESKRISDILSDNLDNRSGRYSSLMDLAGKIYSPENDVLFKALIDDDKADPSFVQHYPIHYFLGRETYEVNPQLLSLIHHPKYPQRFLRIFNTSVRLDENSDSAAVTFSNNKEVIDELIKVDANWYESYERIRIPNINSKVHPLDIEEIIRDTYLAQKVAEKRKEIKVSEVTQKQ